MQKLAWGLVSQRDAFWVQVLRTKYKCGPDMIPCVQRRPGDSNLWQGICHFWEGFLENIGWVVGDGREVRFWKDEWLPGFGRLQHNPSVHLPRLDENLSVASYVLETGEWNVQELRQRVPLPLLNGIINSIPPSENLGKDTVRWKLTSDGSFSTKSAYQALASTPVSTSASFWTSIWRWPVPERVRSFLWLLAKEKLLTNSQRRARQLSDTDTCPRSGIHSESVLHMIRDCPEVSNIWLSIIKLHHQPDFFRLPMLDWIAWNNSKQTTRLYGSNWKTFFGMLCWQIWLHRNKIIFEGNVACLFNVRLVASIMTKNYVSASVPLSLQRNVRAYSQIQVTWLAPPLEWIKCNSDGSVKRSGLESCAGVFRDNVGTWVSGFVRQLGPMSVVQAELWGLYVVAHYAVDRGWKRVHFEIDSEVVFKLVSQGCSDNHPFKTMVQSIQSLLKEISPFKLSHCYREMNQVADKLASLAGSVCSLDNPTIWFDRPPFPCVFPVLSDMAGATFPRRVAI